MLPGLMRSFAAPRRAAATAMSAEKWTSATTGRGDCSHTAANASRQPLRGMAMRTISQPAWASASICARLAATSSAGALSIDCTATGAPPPKGTSPTMTRRVDSFGLTAPGIRPELLSFASAFVIGPASAKRPLASFETAFFALVCAFKRFWPFYPSLTRTRPIAQGFRERAAISA